MRETIQDIFQYSKNLITGENKLNGLPFFNKDFFNDFWDRPAIYFLLDDKDEIIYIGQTTGLLRRLTSHMFGDENTEKKEIFGASWLFVKKDELDLAESIFINLIHPKLNKNIPRIKQVHDVISKYMGIEDEYFKKKYRENISEIVKFWLATSENKLCDVDISKYKNLRRS